MAVQLADDLTTMAARGCPRDRVRAAWARGATSLHLGDPATALQHFRRGLESYREEDDRIDRHLYGHDAGITWRAFGAWAQWMLGEADEAGQEVDAACDLAEQLSHPQSLTFALAIAANVHRDRDDARQTLLRAAAASLISEREGFAQFQLWNRALAGWATARLGRPDEGLAMTSESLQTLERLGSTIGRPFFFATWAELLMPTQPAQAVALIDDALAAATASGELQYHAELLRVKAEALAAQGDLDAARRRLDEAIAVATAQGARALVTRAYSSLARLEHAVPRLCS